MQNWEPNFIYLHLFFQIYLKAQCLLGPSSAGPCALHTLFLRHSDLTEVFKFINGDYTIDADTFLNMIRVIEEAILRNCTKDEVDYIRKFVFENRITAKWNNLPQCCIDCTLS